MKLENLDRAKQIANQIDNINSNLSVLQGCLSIEEPCMRIQYAHAGTPYWTFNNKDREVSLMLLMYAKATLERQLNDLNAELETL